MNLNSEMARTADYADLRGLKSLRAPFFSDPTHAMGVRRGGRKCSEIRVNPRNPRFPIPNPG